MGNLALRIEYDGSCFAGWQTQANAATVQETVEQALTRLAGARVGIVGAGRTDAGVHARGQVANCHLPDGFSVPVDKIAIALNSLLPKSIRVSGAQLVPEQFHARYSATAREYVYRISTSDSVFTRHFTTYYKYPIDLAALVEVSKTFVGQYDFTSFSKLNESTPSYVCRVEHCHWERVSESLLELTIRADRFVYGMVRALTGAMIAAQRGKVGIDYLRDALGFPDRAKLLPLAPPMGLTLERVYYDEFGELFCTLQ